MAPEVVSETPYKENVDVWSLAITIIEMMDRVPPLYYLDGNREIFAEILYGQPPTFNFTIPSQGMYNIVTWMLDADGERRPGAKCVLAVRNRLSYTIQNHSDTIAYIAIQTGYHGRSHKMCQTSRTGCTGPRSVPRKAIPETKADAQAIIIICIYTPI